MIKLSKRTLRLLTVGLVFATAGMPISAEPFLPENAHGTASTGTEAYRSEFETILDLVRDKFHDARLNGVDWKRVGYEYRQKLADVTNKLDFELLVNQMLGELHASHAGYFTDDDIEFYMLPAVLRQDMTGHRVEHIGVMGVQDTLKFVVTAVFDGGPAEKAGILSGDQLLTADGLPFRTAGSFRGKDGRPVEVRFRRPGETAILTVQVTPVRQNILKAFLEATESSARVVTVGGKHIGYVHLWTMANESFRAALERLVTHKLHDTDGLVLDLRDGYGGSPWNYADVFFRPDLAWEQNPRGGGLSTRHTGYGKPMVTLINQGTRSAKEFFAYELKTSKRAKLVGTKTAGAFLGAGGFEVGRDGLLELPILGLKVDGKLLESVGVSPDIVELPGNSYTERDAQLLTGERALLDEIRAKEASVKAAL